MPPSRENSEMLSRNQDEEPGGDSKDVTKQLAEKAKKMAKAQAAGQVAWWSAVIGAKLSVYVLLGLLILLSVWYAFAWVDDATGWFR